MIITFILPGVDYRPVGGYKIVYEYANHLCKENNKVNIIYACDFQLKKFKHIPNFLKKIILLYWYKKPINWFNLNKGIDRKLVWHTLDHNIPNADIIIATGVNTAINTYNLSNNKGKKVYFIQGYENWKFSNDYVDNTYKLDMHKLVVSNWLLNIVKTKSNNVTLIRNGIDTSIFKPLIPFLNRKEHSISLLLHNDKLKGSKIALIVLEELRKKYPDLEVYAFAGKKLNFHVPHWIQLTISANQDQIVEIYNKTRFFLSTSEQEGFGLTSAEAMACGCVVVSSNTNGIHEYAKNRYNSIIVNDYIDLTFILKLDDLFKKQSFAKTISDNAILSIRNDIEIKSSKILFLETLKKVYMNENN